MTIKIINWHYIWGSGVGPNLYAFQWFWLLAALSNDLANFAAQWMTQSAPRYGISVLAVHQKCEAVQRANWVVIPWAPRHWNKQLVAFQFLPGSCIIHTCLAHVRKPSFALWSLYKCSKYFIQKFIGRNSEKMERNCVKSAGNFCSVGWWLSSHSSVP